jgi:hypothetical protein
MKALSEIGDNKTEARSSRYSATLPTVVLMAIVLVGIRVIGGWHLHARLLGQTMPGVIPMQQLHARHASHRRRLAASSFTVALCNEKVSYG